ncbi:hypothetical protein ACMFMF_005773 [Clarireedia jacksonii]
MANAMANAMANGIANGMAYSMANGKLHSKWQMANGKASGMAYSVTRLPIKTLNDLRINNYRAKRIIRIRRLIYRKRSLWQMANSKWHSKWHGP